MVNNNHGGYLGNYQISGNINPQYAQNLANNPNVVAFQHDDKRIAGNRAVFSNFSQDPVVIDNVRYPTTEHYYQIAKLDPRQPGFAQTRDRLLGQSAEQVRDFFGQKNNYGAPHSLDQRTIDANKDSVMQRALEAKFSQQNPEAMVALLSTGTKHMVEAAHYDKYWGCGKDGLGENKLGTMLEQRRNQLFDQLRVPQHDRESYFNNPDKARQLLGLTQQQSVQHQPYQQPQQAQGKTALDRVKEGTGASHITPSGNGLINLSFNDPNAMSQFMAGAQRHWSGQGSFMQQQGNSIVVSPDILQGVCNERGIGSHGRQNPRQTVQALQYELGQSRGQQQGYQQQQPQQPQFSQHFQQDAAKLGQSFSQAGVTGFGHVQQNPGYAPSTPSASQSPAVAQFKTYLSNVSGGNTQLNVTVLQGGAIAVNCNDANQANALQKKIFDNVSRNPAYNDHILQANNQVILRPEVFQALNMDYNSIKQGLQQQNSRAHGM